MESDSLPAAAAPGSDGPAFPPGWRPRHTLKVDETPEGDFTVLKLYVDTGEGRAYEKLSTEVDRLDFMRKHHHDSMRCVQAREKFLEDHEEGKMYLIRIGSPEDEGLEKLEHPDPDEDWPEGSKEREAWVAYFKKNACKIEAMSAKERVQCCSQRSVN